MVDFGKKPEVSYLALIGDIRGSRAASPRARVQSTVLEQLDMLSRRLSKRALLASLRMTAGDEFQALLKDPAAAVEIVLTLADQLYPMRIVFGLGFGPVSTEIRSDPGAIDGPCFHRAREALELARQKGDWVVVRGLPEPGDELVDALFALIDAVRSRWTEKQALYARESRERLQKEVADQFDVVPSVISESLKAARFEAVRAGEDAARAALGHFGSRAEAVVSSALSPNQAPE